MSEPLEPQPNESEPKEGRQVLGRSHHVWTRCILCKEMTSISKVRRRVQQNFICDLCRQNRAEEKNRPAQKLIFDHHPEGQRIGVAKIDRED